LYMFREYYTLCALLLVFITAANAAHADDNYKLSEKTQYSGSSPVIHLNGEWEYGYGREKPNKWNTFSEIPGIPPGRNGSDTLWLRIKLPDRLPHKPVLYVERMIFSFKAYVDKSLRYQFGKFDQNGKAYFSGFKSHTIPLKEKDAGETLLLRVFSRYWYIGPQKAVYIASLYYHKTLLWQKGLAPAIFAGVFFCFGIIFIFAFFRQPLLSQVFFGIFSILMGVYVFHYSSIRDILFDNAVFWYYAWLLSLFLVPAFVMGFFCQLLNNTNNTNFSVFSMINAVLGGVGIIVAGIGGGLTALDPRFCHFIQAIIPLRLIFEFLMVADLIFLISMLGIESIKRNKEAMLLLIGTVILSFFVGYELIAGVGVLMADFQSRVHWGMLAFLITNILVLMMRYGELNRKLERASFNLEVGNLIQQTLIDELLLILDNTGKIHMANPKAEKIIGLKQEKLLKMNADEIIRNWDIIRNKLEASLKEESPVNTQFSILSQIGYEIPISARVSMTPEDNTDNKEGKGRFLIAGQPATSLSAVAQAKGLTEREVEVLSWVLKGYSGKEIAQYMYISYNTVRAHLAHLYEKLEVRNRTELMGIFQEN